MKKKVIYDRLAIQEFVALSQEVQDDFESYVLMLEEHGRLAFPDARKVAENLFEIRIKQDGAYRGFYAYMKDDLIIMLHFFQKKTQKTPQRNILTAQKRAKNYV